MPQLINVVGGDEPLQVEFPDDMSREEIEADLRARFPASAPERSTSQVTVAPASRPSTASEEFRKSLKIYGGSWRTLFDSVDNPEDAALKGLEFQRHLSEMYGRPVSIEETIDAFENDGVIGAAAQVAKDMPRAVVGQIANMAAMMAGTRGGSAAALRLFGKTPQTAVVAGTVGAVIGGAGAVYPLHYAQNIMRQAEADLAAGREVDVNRLTAATAAVAQSGLEYGSMLFMIGKGAIRKALGVPFKANEAATAQKLLDASRRSLGMRTLRGAVRGVVAEVPTELSQQVIERSQAGLDLLSDDALQEYGEIIYQTALVAPVMGGVTGAVQRTPAPRTQPQFEDLSIVRPAGEISEIAEAAAAAGLSEVTEPSPGQITPTALERAAAETAVSPEDLAIRQATQEKIRQITPILEETLKGRGLDDVGFRLSQSLTNIANMRDPEEIKAVFDPDVRTIFLAADRVAGFEGMPEPQLRTELAGLLDHEMVHAMKNMGLWNTSEWNVLESTVQNRTNRQGVTYLKAAQKAYEKETPAVQREEAVAELIRDTFGGRSGVAGRPLNLIQRIIEFFRKLGNSIVGSGFASFNQIVSDIETGIIGARERVTGGIPEPMAAARSADLQQKGKYEGMRDQAVDALRSKGIMSDEQLRIAKLDGYTADPKITYSIEDSAENSSYLTLKKTTEYDDAYGVLDWDEYTIRFSDHPLPQRYAYDRNIYNISEDYSDETINGKSLDDALQYIDRLTVGQPVGEDGGDLLAARRVRPDVEVQQYLPLGEGLTAEELAIDRALLEAQKKRQAAAKTGLAQAREILAEDPKKAARGPRAAQTIKKAKAGGFGELGRILNEWRTSQVPPLESLGTEDVISWFHGTANKQRILDEGFKSYEERSGSYRDPVFWFSSAEPVSETYKPQRATKFDPDPAIMEVYLRGKNPLIFDAEGKNWSNLKVGALADAVDYSSNPEGFLESIRSTSKQLLNRALSSPKDEQIDYLHTDSFREQIITSDRVARIARGMGYDGVIFNRMRDVGPEYYTGQPDFPIIPEQALEKSGVSTVMALFRPRVKGTWTRQGLPDPTATRIRSSEAQFDPEARGSTNILAARGPTNRELHLQSLVQKVREKADQRIAEEVAQGERRRDIVKIEDIAGSLDEDHLATYGRKLDPTVTEDQLIAAKVIADEIDQQMTNDISGQGWYDADVEKTFMLLSQIPGLESLRTNEDHRVIWSAIAGPTSNNMKVPLNARIATAAMLRYLRTGNIPTDPPAAGAVTEGISSAGWGRNQGSVAKGMKVVSKLVDTHGEAGFADWWLSPHSLKELTEIRKEAGLSGPPSGLSGGRDSDHLGAMVIGDKTGRFSLNINGYEGTTKDVWYVRSYNRVFGQMFGNTGKVQGSPRNLTERRQMEAFNQLVLDNVKEEGLSEADAQAILWFHEQILYTELGVVSRPGSFSEGVEAIHDTLKIRPRVRGSDESQAEVEPAEALADWRAISPSERISRWERYQTETQPSAELKTSPEQSDALAADKLKAARENRGTRESEQAAENAAATTRKLAARSEVSDLSRNRVYQEVASISSQRAARGLGNAQTALSWEAPTSAHDWGFVYNVQDKFIDLAKTEEAINEGLTGQGLTPLSAISSPYKGEESMHGIIKNQMREFEDTELAPLVGKLVDLNIDRTELDNFLVLRHAVERNAHIRDINSKKTTPDAALEDGGAGSIYNEQTQRAERLLDDYVKGRMLNEYGFRWNDSTNRWEGGNQRGVELEGIAKDYDEITKGTLKILQRDGLISEKDYNFLSDYYAYYAPLRGQRIDDDIAAEEHHRAGTGVGNLGIRGTEIETATGRVSVAFPPTGSTVSKRLDAIVRGSKNILVGQRLLDLVRNYPNAEYWNVFSEIPSSLATVRELFGVKEGGKQFYIQINDKRLREALLNLDAPQAHKVIRGLGALNRVLSFMSTSLNPPFIISNFLKDSQMAMYTLAAEQTITGGRALDTKGLHGQVFADLLPSIRQVYRGLRGKNLKPELQKEWDDYLASGAKTEWFHAKDPEQSLKTIDDMIAMANGSFKGTARNAWNAVGDFIAHANSAVENGIRFAVFKKARAMMIKNGVDAAEATARSASLSKNLTVNFNRKGNQGQLLNSLFLFFNASVQGTANVVRAVKNSRTVQGMAAAATTMAAMLTLLNEASSEEDEFGKSYYDSLDDFEKERNIVIMKTIFFPETENPQQAYKIPLPWGFNVFWLFGVQMAEISMGQKTIQKASTDMLGAVLGSFSPLGFGESEDVWKFGLKGVTPQVFKPFLEIALNENFFGAPVYRDNFDFGQQLPLSNLSMPRTPEAFKATTEFMNAMTFGNENESGLMGWLSPDMLRHFFNTYTGGAGRFAERALTIPSKLVSGDDIPVNEIPFLRRLLVDASYRESQSNYYERREDILAKSSQVLVERGADRTEYIEKNRGYLLMKRFLSNSDKRIRRINARLNDLDQRMLRVVSLEMRLRIEDQQEKLQEQKKRIYGRFNQRFNDVMEKLK